MSIRPWWSSQRPAPEAAAPPQPPAPPAPAIRVGYVTRHHTRPLMPAERLGRERPWSHAAVRAVLDDRSVVGLVARVEVGPAYPEPPGDGHAAGWLAYAARGETLEILRLTVHPEERFLGVGTALLRAVVRRLGPAGWAYRRVAAVCPEDGDYDGPAYLHGRGFRAVRLLRGHFGAAGDGVEMEYRWELDPFGGEGRP